MESLILFTVSQLVLPDLILTSRNVVLFSVISFEPPHDKTNKMICAPSEDSDQPGHPPSLIRVLAVRMKKAEGLRYPLSAQRRLWSDWADAKADLSLRWAQSHFVGFVMSWLIFHNFLLCSDSYLWKSPMSRMNCHKTSRSMISGNDEFHWFLLRDTRTRSAFRIVYDCLELA